MQNIVELKSVIQNAADAEGFPVRFIPIKNALDLYGDETEDVCPPLFIGNPPVSRWNSEERANNSWATPTCLTTSSLKVSKWTR